MASRGLIFRKLMQVSYPVVWKVIRTYGAKAEVTVVDKADNEVEITRSDYQLYSVVGLTLCLLGMALGAYIFYQFGQNLYPALDVRESIRLQQNLGIFFGFGGVVLGMTYVFFAAVLVINQLWPRLGRKFALLSLVLGNSFMQNPSLHSLQKQSAVYNSVVLVKEERRMYVYVATFLTVFVLLYLAAAVLIMIATAR